MLTKCIALLDNAWQIVKCAYYMKCWRKPKLLAIPDKEIIRRLKEKYCHMAVPFSFTGKKLVVDRLHSAAAPGTLESAVIILSELLKINGSENKMLNVGGGTGQLSSIFSSIGFDVYNVDIQVENQDSCNITVNLNNPEPLPFEDNSFQFIYCAEVIEHIENPWKLFRDISKVVNPEGYFLLTTPNIQSIQSRLSFLRTGFFNWFGPSFSEIHINPLPFWEIELISSKNNFKIIDIFGSGEYFFHQTVKRSHEQILRDNEILLILMKKEKR